MEFLFRFNLRIFSILFLRFWRIKFPETALQCNSVVNYTCHNELKTSKSLRKSNIYYKSLKENVRNVRNNISIR